MSLYFDCTSSEITTVTNDYSEGSNQNNQYSYNDLNQKERFQIEVGLNRLIILIGIGECVIPE